MHVASYIVETKIYQWINESMKNQFTSIAWCAFASPKLSFEALYHVRVEPSRRLAVYLYRILLADDRDRLSRSLTNYIREIRAIVRRTGDQWWEIGEVRLQWDGCPGRTIQEIFNKSNSFNREIVAIYWVQIPLGSAKANSSYAWAKIRSKGAGLQLSGRRNTWPFPSRSGLLAEWTGRFLIEEGHLTEHRSLLIRCSFHQDLRISTWVMQGKRYWDN